MAEVMGAHRLTRTHWMGRAVYGLHGLDQGADIDVDPYWLVYQDIVNPVVARYLAGELSREEAITIEEEAWQTYIAEAYAEADRIDSEAWAFFVEAMEEAASRYGGDYDPETGGWTVDPGKGSEMEREEAVNTAIYQEAKETSYQMTDTADGHSLDRPDLFAKRKRGSGNVFALIAILTIAVGAAAVMKKPGAK